MSLERDKRGFQPRYFLVGNGVVRIPANLAGFGVGVDGRSGRARGAQGVGAGPSGWLVRLFGHAKRRVATRRAWKDLGEGHWRERAESVDGGLFRRETEEN
jgi:hypothetical protein